MRHLRRTTAAENASTTTQMSDVGRRVRKHREKLKQDSTKYEEEKEKDRIRKQQERKRKREQMQADNRLLAQHRADKRIEMRKYREKKKASMDKETPTVEKLVAGKLHQKKIKDQRRKTEERLKKGLQNAKKKEAVFRTKACRMKVQLRSPDPHNTTDTLASTSPFSSTRTERRTLSRETSSKNCKSVPSRP